MSLIFSSFFALLFLFSFTRAFDHIALPRKLLGPTESPAPSTSRLAATSPTSLKDWVPGMPPTKIEPGPSGMIPGIPPVQVPPSGSKAPKSSSPDKGSSPGMSPKKSTPGSPPADDSSSPPAAGKAPKSSPEDDDEPAEPVLSPAPSGGPVLAATPGGVYVVAVAVVILSSMII